MFPPDPDRYPRVCVYSMQPQTPTAAHALAVQMALARAADETRSGYVYSGNVVEDRTARMVALAHRPAWKAIADRGAERGAIPDLVIVADFEDATAGDLDYYQLLRQRSVEVCWGRPGGGCDTRLPCWKHVRRQILECVRRRAGRRPLRIHPEMRLRLPHIAPLFKAFGRELTDAQAADWLNRRNVPCPSRLDRGPDPTKVVPPNRWLARDVREWKESTNQWHLIAREHGKADRRDMAVENRPAGDRPRPERDGPPDGGTAAGGGTGHISHADGSGI